jgi:hypothetical protein
MLPFTEEQFVAVFVDYNLRVWPAQVAAYLLGMAAVVALVRGWPGSDRLIGITLAAMWSWAGVVYHGLYFSAINGLAPVFGILFVLQGLVFVHSVVVRRQLHFGTPSGPAAWLGWALVAYASIVYPLVGWWTGHAYPAMPMFGITPCPVTLFTFGLLLLTTTHVPRWLLAVPLLWSLVGGSAAFLLGFPQDWPLLLGGATAVLMIELRDRQRRIRPAKA